jgi:SET family sugar efflux transporter-like MFS transporter
MATMTDATPTRPRLPVTAFFGASLFFSGVTYASTLPYGAIVGIDTLGLPNATYALLLMVGSLVTASTSVALGWLSDRVPDRRLIVIFCALMGALGWGLLFLLRNQFAYILAVCLIMPFGGALFSQSFSFARAYYDARRPDNAEFMVSMLRTVFTVAWAVVPPVVGWVAASTGVFEVYGIAAAAYLVCAVIYASLFAEPTAKVGRPPRTVTTAPDPSQPRSRVDLTVIGGLVGVVLIFIATQLNGITVPLVIMNNFSGTLADVGLYAGLAAALEVPFMVMWGFVARRVPKHTIIVGVALLYAVYLVLVSRSGSVAELLWLQPLNGLTTAGLMSMPIAYVQEAIRGRVGLSTSLLDVTNVTATLSTAAIFAAVTVGTPDYPLVLMVAAGLSALGAVVLFAAHRWLKPARP